MIMNTNRPRPVMTVGILASLLVVSAAYAAKIGSNRIKPNAVTTEKLSDGAVTSEKLSPGERSVVFVTNRADAISVQPSDASVSDADRIAELILPEGNWVVQGYATFGSSAAAARSITCVIRDEGSTVTKGTIYTPSLAVYSHVLALSAVVTGGAVDLACEADGAANARDRVLIATQVGAVVTQ